MLEQQHTLAYPIPMTLAWHLGYRSRHRYYFKEGGGAGFHCMMRLYKDHGFGTVLMTNGTTFNVSKTLDAVDALLWAGV